MPPAGLRIPTCLTLEPIPDESLVGYVFRLSHHRVLPNARAQFIDCGFPYPLNQPEPEWLAALAASSSMEIGRLEAISYGPPDRVSAIVLGHRVSQSVLERRGMPQRRICPACLSERAYHRAMWDLRYIAVCPVHGCLLEDTCRHCGDPLMWKGSNLLTCRKNHRLDLGGMEPTLVEAADVEATAAVYGLFGDPRFQRGADGLRGLAPLADLQPADIAEFLFRLGLERMGRDKKVFSSESPGELAWAAHIALRRGVEALDPWPDVFHQTLDGMRERWGSTAQASLRLCAGAVERWGAGLPSECGRRIMHAVTEYRAIDAARMVGEQALSVGHPHPRRLR